MTTTALYEAMANGNIRTELWWKKVDVEATTKVQRCTSAVKVRPRKEVVELLCLGANADVMNADGMNADVSYVVMKELRGGAGISYLPYGGHERGSELGFDAGAKPLELLLTKLAELRRRKEIAVPDAVEVSAEKKDEATKLTKE
ncbi:unnamed protein product [Peronospora destructor]|uniref:Uncharacterized protein n=1 Tax=Peronospora destructor TaxID=86335 RepID=A0AAV0T8Q5_9STRA|nr:unnamed protein product [Peronospora destructor]